MQRLTGIVCALLTLALTGCITAGTPPTIAEQQAANFGATPTGYEESIHRYFDETLKDPGSIQYKEVTTPTKGYTQTHSLAGGTKRNYGWLVKATINAKNAYGGYVGFGTYTFLFRGEEIVDTMTPHAE